MNGLQGFNCLIKTEQYLPVDPTGENAVALKVVGDTTIKNMSYYFLCSNNFLW